MKRMIAATFVLLALAGVAHGFGLGLGNRFGKLGAIDQGGGGSGPPPATGKLLRIDATSHILRIDGTSKICRIGGC